MAQENICRRGGVHDERHGKIVLIGQPCADETRVDQLHCNIAAPHIHTQGFRHMHHRCLRCAIARGRRKATKARQTARDDDMTCILCHELRHDMAQDARRTHDIDIHHRQDLVTIPSAGMHRPIKACKIDYPIYIADIPSGFGHAFRITDIHGHNPRWAV